MNSRAPPRRSLRYQKRVLSWSQVGVVWSLDTRLRAGPNRPARLYPSRSSSAVGTYLSEAAGRGGSSASDRGSAVQASAPKNRTSAASAADLLMVAACMIYTPRLLRGSRLDRLPDDGQDLLALPAGQRQP